MTWVALKPSYMVPSILPPRPPLCGHAYYSRAISGWVGDCDDRALFIRTNDEGRAEYACASHAA